MFSAFYYDLSLSLSPSLAHECVLYGSPGCESVESLGVSKELLQHSSQVRAQHVVLHTHTHTHFPVVTPQNCFCAKKTFCPIKPPLGLLIIFSRFSFFLNYHRCFSFFCLFHFPFILLSTYSSIILHPSYLYPVSSSPLARDFFSKTFMKLFLSK